MRSWQSKKKEIQSLTETEKSELSLAASLVAQIIETREKKGWTQRDLAQRSGIAQSSIARFERCGAMPRLDTFAKISNCVGLRLALVENPYRGLSVRRLHGRLFGVFFCKKSSCVI